MAKLTHLTVKFSVYLRPKGLTSAPKRRLVSVVGLLGSVILVSKGLSYYLVRVVKGSIFDFVQIKARRVRDYVIVLALEGKRLDFKEIRGLCGQVGPPVGKFVRIVGIEVGQKIGQALHTPNSTQSNITVLLYWNNRDSFAPEKLQSLTSEPLLSVIEVVGLRIVLKVVLGHY